MSVVRREGDWRLEKRSEGVYEVTHRTRTEAKILTADYVPESFHDERDDLFVPVHEVGSYSEAESLFRELAADGGASGGFGMSGSTGANSTFTDDVQDLADLPPGGFLMFGVVGLGILLTQRPVDVRSPLFLFGVAFTGVGLLVLGLTYRAYSEEGISGAIAFLTGTTDTTTAADTADRDTPTKTPPAPSRLKEDLYFERANQRCEWCDTRVDSPDVHHIEPRREGGPNDPENLIVLCPNCHRKADREAITRSKLSRKVQIQMNDQRT